MRVDSETLTKVRDYIMYPFMLQMITHWNEQISRTDYSLRELYEAIGWLLHKRIDDDFILLKREFRERKIRVWEGNHDGDINRYRFNFNGYEENFGIMRETLKAEIRLRLGKYRADLKQSMRSPAGN